MRWLMQRNCAALVAALGFGLLQPLSIDAAEPKDVEFFEAKIRPVLVAQCYECHSASSKALKGGLRLDTRAGWATGGDSGPAIVPGKPDESLLIQAVRYDPQFVQMPPNRRLPETVVKDLEQWVARGAVDPRTEVATASSQKKKPAIDLAAARQYWAYQPPKKLVPPPVGNDAWPQGAIDRFVLARLEAAKLEPAADADRRTLMRRLYFDLVGLPPRPEEIVTYLDDNSPNAYEALVDRLLASPEFGERWGRHWLDVVRYGESLTLRGFVLPEAWRYRDYVIEAFNDDLPFDQFVREQVAGDLLPAATPAERRRQKLATAFLALGNTNLEEQDKQQLRMDIVDEQLDTIGKAFLAQTIGCARCHDHKFDPIPTRDYYAMAGILRNTRTVRHANVSKWIEAPLPLEPDEEAIYAKHDAEVAAVEARMAPVREAMKAALASADDKASGESPAVLAAKDLPGVVVDDSQAKAIGQWKPSQHSRRYIGDGYLHDENQGKGTKTLTFTPKLPKAGLYEVRLAYTQANNRATNVPVTIFSADGEQTVTVNMREPPDTDGRFNVLGRFNFEAGDQGFIIVATEGTDGYVAPDAAQFLPVETSETLLKEAKRKFADKLPDEAQQAVDALKKLEKELASVKKQGPKRPMGLSVEEEREIEDARIHVRGGVHNLGESVPRGFLQAASYEPAKPLPQGESGRREFGDWLASEKNPLTARVMANRVWHWLIGSGLVRTTDNFGVAGEPPSHPELLDHLAVSFVEQGWSVKRLVRDIVMSRTYRMSTADNPKALASDPENRLIWRMNRRRLDAECIRDAMLVASGQLDPTRGGSTVPGETKADYSFQHTGHRRSVYLPVFRNSLPELFDAFDFADPSMTTGRRNVSTVSPQALFLLNHPFVQEQASKAAEQLLATTKTDAAGRVDRAFERVLGRSPSATERERTLAFVNELTSDAEESNYEAAWAQVFQGLFASIDFRYVD